MADPLEECKKEGGSVLPILTGCIRIYCDPQTRDAALKSEIRAIEGSLKEVRVTADLFSSAVDAYGAACATYLAAKDPNTPRASIVATLIDAKNLGDDAERARLGIDAAGRFSATVAKVLKYKDQGCTKSINASVLAAVDPARFNGVAKRLNAVKCNRADAP